LQAKWPCQAPAEWPVDTASDRQGTIIVTRGSSRAGRAGTGALFYELPYPGNAATVKIPRLSGRAVAGGCAAQVQVSGDWIGSSDKKQNMNLYSREAVHAGPWWQ